MPSMDLSRTDFLSRKGDLCWKRKFADATRPSKPGDKIFAIAHNHLFLGGGGAEGALGLTFCGVDLHFSS